MTFLGEGLWHTSIPYFPSAKTGKDFIRFEFTDTDSSFKHVNERFGGRGNPYRIIVGSRATWAPERPAFGGELSITYDATGGPLQGKTHIWIHSGYNKYEGADWVPAFELPMKNMGGEKWSITVTMQTNRFKTFNMHFRDRNPLGDTWDNEFEPLHWVVFPQE